MHKHENRAIKSVFVKIIPSKMIITRKPMKSNRKEVKNMKIYTTFEISEILKVSEGTVRDWIRKGKLGATKLGGTKTVRISEEDLTKFYNDNKVVSGT